MNIRKCAIASFFEWDKLDHAVGGSQQTLGTKLHQHTREAIAKCQPALMTVIRKFNSYCECLESLYDPTWNIPLPTPLPTKLAELRGDHTFMQDVWIMPSMGEVPRWLEDLDIRDSIRALLKHEWCLEEQTQWSGMEADNLCCFFGEELTALELSLRLPTNARFLFTSHVEQALDHATVYSEAPRNIAPQLASVIMQDPIEDEPVLPDMDNLVEIKPEQAALADILEGDTAGAGFEEDQDLLSNVCANVVWHTPEMDISNPTMAIFSIHDLPRIRYNVTDNMLWCNTSWTHYWEKDVWVLPIHRLSNVGHWVLCVIYLSRKELHLFNSLAEQKPWRHNVKVGSC
ncbi:hypothetical protein EDD22DRAFT_981359 [Suillus occidentalis]|nr:hypothetical protein EDD22DRAFT_981359 [Suillus occidentalis]